MPRRPISITYNPQLGRTKPWQVRYRDGNGKRKSKFCATQEEADNYATTRQLELERYSLRVLSLSDTTREEALRGVELLQPYGQSLMDAVRFYIGHMERTKRSCPVEQLVEKYLWHKQSHHVSPLHLYDVQNRLKHFAKAFPGKLINAFEAEEIGDWIMGLRVKPQTKLNYRRVLHAFFAYAVRGKYADSKPTEDKDSMPAGNQYAGDGLSAYEEYRGFMVHGKHRRTDWKLKDVFIWDRDSMGLGDFPFASGLECWSILPNEMKGGDVVEINGRTTYPPEYRVINFNHKTAHLHDQTGLVLANEPHLTDDEGNELYGVSKDLGPPIHVMVVQVDRASHDQEVSKAITNRELNGTTDWELPATITHELGHAVGIRHHGRTDSTLVYFTASANDSHVPKDKKGQPLPVVVVKDATTIGETGMYLKSGYSLPGTYYFCTKHGLYSGEAECYMRYVHPPNSLYRTGRPALPRSLGRK